MASDIKLNDSSVILEGNVGVGTNNPARPLHVEGNEIHSGGAGAGFSFSDRNNSVFVNNPSSTKGERWVWYATEKTARLWCGVDHIQVRPNVNEQNQPGTVVISGDLTVGNNLTVNGEIQGELRFLTGVSDKAPDGSDIRLATMVADTLSVSNSGSLSRRRHFALHSDIDIPNNKELLVINYQGNYKSGVKIEGNVQVTGTLTQASSIALKENIAELSGQEAMTTLQGLNAVKYNYKADQQKEQRIGFIAEEVPDLVANSERDRLSPMDLIAVLTKALQEQQITISELVAEMNTLKQQNGAHQS
ncbi:tail fiber domain-containing protein [Nodosilinea sp. LEGE 07088]|uniref:tail fiber domain-containing protein n=1 Tax=Nodosilinea sp. LEGE 07088 TaxID=2777968 RepID=UPI001881AF77|nr:tail fiber domain-containing protein [Nodosilinea sp. LEGE 07088]MBE9139176.1 tail fiber domain-containing protein [Nodosilinea sp. LEGE 07088]